MSLTDSMLHAWIAGALEPPRALEIEEALQRDPTVRERALALLAEPSPVHVDPWRIPPPGIAGGQSRTTVSVHGAAVFGGALRPGDRFELRVASPEDPDSREVVVLRQQDGGWGVVFPTEADERLPLAQLLEVDDERVLELSAGPEPGRQRWAIALPDAPHAPDWSAPEDARWRALTEGIARGRVPTASAEIEVAATG